MKKIVAVCLYTLSLSRYLEAVPNPLARPGKEVQMTAKKYEVPRRTSSKSARAPTLSSRSPPDGNTASRSPAKDRMRENQETTVTV